MKNIFIGFCLLSTLYCFGQKEYYGINEVTTFPSIREYDCFSKDGQKCLNEQLTKHFYLFMTYPTEMARLKKSGRAVVQIKIDKNGVVQLVQSRSQDKAFELEAKRVFEALPVLLPAKLKRKNVGSVIALPVIFQWPDEDLSGGLTEEDLGEFYAVFPGCSRSEGVKANKDCFTLGVQLHIKNSFKYPYDALRQGVHGTVRLKLKIGHDGRISVESLTSPHRSLTREALRIVSLFPRVNPAWQKGRSVVVTYNLPIAFAILGVKGYKRQQDYRGYMGQNNREN